MTELYRHTASSILRRESEIKINKNKMEVEHDHVTLSANPTFHFLLKPGFLKEPGTWYMVQLVQISRWVYRREVRRLSEDRLPSLIAMR